MKAYSNANSVVPREQVKEAQVRRKCFTKSGRFCRGYYTYQLDDGRMVTQLDDSLDLIGKAAQAMGADRYYWFAGSLEAYLDGEPYEEIRL